MSVCEAKCDYIRSLIGLLHTYYVNAFSKIKPSLSEAKRNKNIAKNPETNANHKTEQKLKKHSQMEVKSDFTFKVDT